MTYRGKSTNGGRPVSQQQPYIDHLCILDLITHLLALFYSLFLYYSKLSNWYEPTLYGGWMGFWPNIRILFQKWKYIFWIPMGVIFMGFKLGVIDWLIDWFYLHKRETRKSCNSLSCWRPYSDKNVQSILIAWNKTVRKIYNLPFVSHRAIQCGLSKGFHAWDYIYKRFCKMYECMLISENSKLSMLVGMSQDDC